MIKKYPVLGGLAIGVATALLSSGIPVRALATHRHALGHPASLATENSSKPPVAVTPMVSDASLASTAIPASSLAAAPSVDSRSLESASAMRSIPDIWPVAGRISSIYTPHRMHPILGRYAPHYGLDLAAPYGTPIHATADGMVMAVVNSRSYGLGVDINHGAGYITRYAHASRLVVQKGEYVHQGDVIAYVGSTGLSTGPHCHYEIFHNGWSVDPASMLAKP